MTYHASYHSNALGNVPLPLLFQFSSEHLFVIMSLFLVLFFSVYISMPYLLDPQLASKGFISVVCFPAWFKNPLWPLFLVTFFICIISHVLSIDEIIKKNIMIWFLFLMLIQLWFYPSQLWMQTFLQNLIPLLMPTLIHWSSHLNVMVFTSQCYV